MLQNVNQRLRAFASNFQMHFLQRNSHSSPRIVCIYINVHPAQSGWRAICPNTANNFQYKLERPRRLLIVRLVIPGGGNYMGHGDERARSDGDEILVIDAS